MAAPYRTLQLFGSGTEARRRARASSVMPAATHVALDESSAGTADTDADAHATVSNRASRRRIRNGKGIEFSSNRKWFQM